MNFTPVIPLGGLAGWQFLQRTEETQRQTFSNSAQVKRDLDYFRENIGKIDTAEQLVKDYRLLNVALGAFGLGDDIGNKFFIRKVLDDGTLDPDALGNKLADKRYLAMSKAFGFGDFDTPNTKLSTFPDEIAAKFKDRSFEAAVGQSNDNMRLALNARRELAELAARPSSATTKWFTVLGTPALRTVVEGALNLPNTFARIPLDQQLTEIQDRAESVLGSSDPSVFANEETLSNVIDRFLINASITNNSFAATSGAATALILLGGG